MFCSGRQAVTGCDCYTGCVVVQPGQDQAPVGMRAGWHPRIIKCSQTKQNESRGGSEATNKTALGLWDQAGLGVRSPWHSVLCGAVTLKMRLDEKRSMQMPGSMPKQFRAVLHYEKSCCPCCFAEAHSASLPGAANRSKAVESRARLLASDAGCLP